jgi:hypothetical protein
VESSPLPSPPLARLRRLARPPPAHERCELCGAPIGPGHPHVLELGSRQLHCACDACAILFDGRDDQRFRRVPSRVTRLPEIEPSEALWENLHVPINLAFFYRCAAAGDKVIAMYPSPAGATESALPPDAWDEMAARSPALCNIQSEVEALIINHVGRRRDCFLVSIDECYRLVGLIRANWRGLSGGGEVWKAIDGFFDELHRRAGAKRGEGGSRA